MLERTVAIKLMQPQLLEDEEALKGFYREARVVASLNHTNIIHVYTFDYWNDQLYLAMELADNGSLDSWIRASGTVPELNVLDVGIKMGYALGKALQHSILHRDIKPDNILFDADGEPKLVDFGLAGSMDDQDDSGEIWATPYYIAPEKVMRERETFLSDMYSLAATLYHALTGHVPFEADDMNDVVAAHVHTPLTPPNQVNPAVTQPTSDAIYHAMAKDPSDRYQSYDEWIMALTAAHSQLMVKQYNITTN
jgi:serine/threonine-protein kinase